MLTMTGKSTHFKDARIEYRQSMYPESTYGKPETFERLTIYQYEKNGSFFALIFRGTSAKPCSHFRYPTAERRTQHLDKIKKDEYEIMERNRQWRAERKQEHKDISVGDILVNSWGYDQTNVDFYEVIRATASRLWIVEIGSKSVDCQGSSMSDMLIADPTHKGTKIEMIGRGKYGKWSGRPMYHSWYA